MHLCLKAIRKEIESLLAREMPVTEIKQIEGVLSGKLKQNVSDFEKELIRAVQFAEEADHYTFSVSKLENKLRIEEKPDFAFIWEQREWADGVFSYLCDEPCDSRNRIVQKRKLLKSFL